MRSRVDPSSETSPAARTRASPCAIMFGRTTMRIPGTAKPDTLNGTSEDDTIFGFGANDQLFGNDGDDRLSGGEGADVLDGGNGRDWACYDDAPAGGYVVLIPGAGYGGEAAGDTLISIENLSGS